MKTIAYIRVSTATQDLDQQRLAVWEYAHQNRLTIDEFVTVKASSSKSLTKRLTGYLTNFNPMMFYLSVNFPVWDGVSLRLSLLLRS